MILFVENSNIQEYNGIKLTSKSVEVRIMKNSKFIKKRKFDLIICIVFTLILIISLLSDLFWKGSIFNVFTIKAKSVEDLMNTLFTVQVTRRR
jgi:hypothetical protein